MELKDVAIECNDAFHAGVIKSRLHSMGQNVYNAESVPRENFRYLSYDVEWAACAPSYPGLRGKTIVTAEELGL